MAIASVYLCHQCVCHTLVASVNSVNYCPNWSVTFLSYGFSIFDRVHSNYIVSCHIVKSTDHWVTEHYTSADLSSLKHSVCCETCTFDACHALTPGAGNLRHM